MKSDLLANISHELRTPLTSVKGYCEALHEELLGPITAEQREAIEVSQRNVDRLLVMIDELLSYSRFASGAVQLSTWFASSRASVSLDSMLPLTSNRS